MIPHPLCRFRSHQQNRSQNCLQRCYSVFTDYYFPLPKNPTESLETLRRTSITTDDLKMPSTRKLSDRDMPEHAVSVPAKSSSPSKFTSSATEPSYFPSTSGGDLATVPEEEGSAGLGNDGTHDDLSPHSSAPQVSNATLAAEISAGATSTGKPMFSEPDFGFGEAEQQEAPSELVRRSPGSFSAATAREDNPISPTER
jgi:hypothetical protein